MQRDGYYFGSVLTRRLDYFAFPRTGSHYLWLCLTGLFDLVFLENEHTQAPEARQRAEELHDWAGYGMTLREDGVPHQPVWIDAAPAGLHGAPVPGRTGRERPALVLLRDPHPTVYSLYATATDRWGLVVAPGERPAWITDTYRRLADWYGAVLEVLADPAASGRVLVLRYEELVADAGVLRQVVDFVGVRPKLDPAFVHWWTCFGRLTREGPRTFYRAGDNRAWAQDAGWCADLKAATLPDLTRFGYGPPRPDLPPVPA